MSEDAGASSTTRPPQQPPAGFWSRTFSSLRVPNYRLYFTGQSISLIGTWMQMTAQSWLVLTLTHSSTALGLTVALQTLPVLLFGPYGGVGLARRSRRVAAEAELATVPVTDAGTEAGVAAETGADVQVALAPGNDHRARNR
ncbi:MAG TPA: MFS transporter [Actinocrinis sp.]|nr:MFS transporter [Actinocrinis sp.]